jgi:hypothetical protein
MEEVVGPQTENGSSFEPTRLRQFTIFLENRVGRLQLLVRALEDGPHDIVTIAIEESADSALVRMVCRNPDATREALRIEGFGFTESEVLAVELPKRHKQPLMAITAALLSAEINIHYLYPLLRRHDQPALILYVEDPVLATQLLIRRGFTLLSESDFRSSPHRSDANGDADLGPDDDAFSPPDDDGRGDN